MDQILNIWQFFYSNEVKYLVVGGFAVNIYGFNRNTGDLDILIEDSIENRKKIRKSFIDIGIGDFESIENMQFLPEWTDFTLAFGMRLDLMTEIKGLENKSFDELLSVATIVKVGNIPVNFIDSHNLILAKKATNRLKDQLDIAELQKINENK